jgi:2-oxoglutarate dehydrogenase E1 component
MMKQFLANSYLFGGNAPFVEEVYESYLNNPQSVTGEWREFFDKMQVLPGAAARDVPHAPIVESFAQRAKQGSLRVAPPPTELSVERKQVYVLLLIHAYRIMGSRWAELDPLKRQPRPQIPELEPAYYDLTEADLETSFNTGTLVGPERATLAEILQILRETYCGTIGVEYMYISDMPQKRWIQQRIEAARGRPQFPPEVKKRILERITAAETLEKYLHTRFVGQKRFSLEGGETTIACMDECVQRAGAHGL